jgi:hypothetical protein
MMASKFERRLKRRDERAVNGGMARRRENQKTVARREFAASVIDGLPCGLGKGITMAQKRDRPLRAASKQ